MQMLYLRRTVLALSLAIACPALALADPAFQAADIIAFFEKQTKLGVTRAICVGTEDECNQKVRLSGDVTFNLSVTFELDSHELSLDAKQNLDEFAKALESDNLATASFAVDGHTDASGGESYNLSLSQRRADTVVGYLTSKGVEPQRLSAQGFGESFPRSGDPFDPENRRVETRRLLQ